MKIATFNINGINTRLYNLLDWLGSGEADIVCLQELKATQSQFPEARLQEAGYSTAWVGEQRWNGVAILSRVGELVVTRHRLPGDPADRQARYIEAAVNGVLVGCLYLPNGNPWPGPRFDYKLAWFDRLRLHAETLVASDAPVILAGDFNVVPTERDIYNSRSWQRDALLQAESRAAFSDLVAQGWTDALLERFPDQPPWTFWQYFRQAWERDAGLRIDHLMLSPSLTPRLRDAGVDRWVRGVGRASDHAPAWVELD